jgi:hypothetical protein
MLPVKESLANQKKYLKISTRKEFYTRSVDADHIMMAAAPGALLITAGMDNSSNHY